jgi:small-conductance mechanosensitive channel
LGVGVIDFDDPLADILTLLGFLPLGFLVFVIVWATLTCFADAVRARWARLRQRRSTPWLLVMRATFPMRHYLLRRAEAEAKRQMLEIGFKALLQQRDEHR